MLNLLLRPLRFLVQALVGNDSARQTAWALALGMMVGLLPKGTLLAVGLGMLLCAVRINMAAALLAVGLFSYLGAQLDPFAHKLGALALTWPAAQGWYQRLYVAPLGPWLGFNNTVVMGQLLIGLYLLYPAYRLGLVLGLRVQPKIRRWLMQYKAIRWLRGAEWGAQWGLDG